jgi:transcriptional regulator with PAS, ATPase and Fis domain
LIGLVAFTEEQQNRIAFQQQSLLQFLQIMADLISSKLAMASHNDFMKIALDSILSTEASVTSFSSIMGTSHSLHSVLKRAMQVAPSDSTVLITGESGTGKELFARSIHQASPRKDKPFVSINCGAIPEMLLESELFGYEKGAFTGASPQGKLGKFEIADGGTIFLDEIGDMPLHLQVKLLSALQNRQIERIGGMSPVNINLRIIAATNKNLEEAIQSREFREDLFYRLNVIPLFIPPLRERPEDIPPLLDFVLNKFTSKLNKSISGLTEDANQLLLRYPWPGNVRELENTIEFAVTLEPSNHITVGSLPDRIQRWSSDSSAITGNLKERLDHCQKRILQEVLFSTGSSLAGKRKAAEMLKISESTLYRRLRELGIE